MFASLLPGIRDLRTPLAVGLLWIALAWVWGAELVPGEETATGLLRQFYRLTGVFGFTIVATIAGFTAYLLGVLLSPLHLDWSPIRRVLPLRLRTLSWQSAELFDQRYRNALLRLQRIIEDLESASPGGEERYSRLARVERLREIDREVARAEQSIDLEEDIKLMSMRLQGSHTSLYDDFDRYRAESEFRRCIALPLAFLIVSVWIRLAGTASVVLIAACSCGLILLIVLHVLSWRKAREGNDLIIQSMVIGLVQSPTIEAIDAAVERVTEENLGFQVAESP